CIYDAVSNSGQSALDIAKFWNHVNVIRVFEDHPRTSYKDKEAPTNFFGYNPLDRCAVKRSDDKWLESTLQKDDSVFLLYSNSYPLVKFDPNGKPQLCQFRYNNIRSIIDNTTTKPNIIFLGAKCKEQEGSNDFNEAWFAVDATGVPTEQITDLAPGAEYLSGAGGLRLMQLHESIAGIVAQGRSLLAWHARYKFCPTCGNKTFLTEAGYKRKCENDECINHREIHNSSYPRTDPVVIMLVVSSGGDKCLLGRAKSWPPGMYFCLAGFMEPAGFIEPGMYFCLAGFIEPCMYFCLAGFKEPGMNTCLAGFMEPAMNTCLAGFMEPAMYLCLAGFKEPAMYSCIAGFKEPGITSV
uniref:Peroxisomal NADH pyrophosphatase NUDT12-like n=1 Tax=Saccoglossus kowalevskii TaxID=10224 RepID=A0ABM0MXH7_SACKO